MRVSADALLTVVLVSCAVITTSIVVRREFLAPPAPGPSQRQKAVLVENWKSYLDKGVRFGSPNAPVQVIEFADFECPFCASLHADLKQLRSRYPNQVALYFVHYPLPGHRFAEPATRAAECAGDQGHFEAMHDRLFEQQNQLGLKPWQEFAREADVPDLATFQACIEKGDPVPRIVDGQQVGEQLDVRGTPTLMINGWKLAGPPRPRELDRMVKTILSGESSLPEALDSD